jgi:mRNA-degrading endonuclease RelE of RelBE toxin-antitoxin system
MFSVLIKKKVLKEVEEMPVSVQEKLAALVDDLRERDLSNPDGRITARSAKKSIIAI